MTNMHADPTIEICNADTSTALTLPLVEQGISAGFPSPALDFVELSIDLNKHLIKNPPATFFGKVSGDSMRDAGIESGDLLVIDRSINPCDGKIVVCYLDGEFLLKQIKQSKRELWLVSANSEYRPIRVGEESELMIWGVVTHVIKTF